MTQSSFGFPREMLPAHDSKRVVIWRTPEIMRQLEGLAKELGGELIVEKHVAGNHQHTHDHAHETH